MVARTKNSVKTAAEYRVKSVSHDSGISPIVSEYRKLGILSDDAKPCRALIFLMQNVLLSVSHLSLQYSLNFLSSTDVGFLVRNRSWSFSLHLMRRLPFPAADAESAFADIAVLPVFARSFTIIADLFARFAPAYAPAQGRLSLYVPEEAKTSANKVAGERSDYIRGVNKRLPNVIQSLSRRCMRIRHSGASLDNGILKVEKIGLRLNVVTGTESKDCISSGALMCAGSHTT